MSIWKKSNFAERWSSGLGKLRFGLMADPIAPQRKESTRLDFIPSGYVAGKHAFPNRQSSRIASDRVGLFDLN